jgi:hypothetical protein
MIKSVNARFASRSEQIKKQWGGMSLGLRSRAAARKKRARTTVQVKQ